MNDLLNKHDLKKDGVKLDLFKEEKYVINATCSCGGNLLFTGYGPFNSSYTHECVKCKKTISLAEKYPDHKTKLVKVEINS